VVEVESKRKCNIQDLKGTCSPNPKQSI